MNRNIFSLVFNKARNMLVVAPEIAKGAHKSCRRKAASASDAHAAKPRLMFALAPHAITATLALGGISVAHAQSTAVTNAGFETGDLTGWTAGGGTGTQSSTAYSSTGVGVAVVNSMTSFDSTAGQEPGTYSWTVNPYGNYMASLQATGSLSSSNSFSTAMTALGLSSTSSTDIANALAASGNGSVTNAAWITQTLNLTAGQTFSMAWEYISTDYEPFNDGSITSLVNTSDPSNLATVNNQSAQYALLGATNTGTGDYSTGSYGSTGWEVSTYTVSETGTYTLGFASFNLSDEVNSPILFVDQAPGTTYNNGVPFNPVAPNAGTGAPTTQTASNITATDNAAGLAASPATLLPVFDGGTLALDGTDLTPYNFTITGNGGTVDLAGQSATISNPIADDSAGVPGSLTIANSGSGGALTLTGVNTYTGSTTIDSGAALMLSGAGSIASSSGVTDNGTFDIQGANGNESIAALAGTGTVDLGGNGLTITNGNGSNFSGVINGSAGITIDGGTQVLSGNNTYQGGTTLNGGTLQVSNDANLGNASGALTFNGGTLENTGTFTTTRDINLTGDANFNTDTGTTLTDTAGAITGAGSIDKQGAGTLVLGAVDSTGGVNVNAGELQVTGQSTYTGATTVASGATLALNGNGSIANSASVTDNGTLDVGSANQDSSITTLSGNGAVDLGSHTLTLTQAGDTFGGSIQGTGGLTVSGGNETLTGTNSYLGATTIDNGATLSLTNNGQLSDDALSGGVVDNGTFDIHAASGTQNISTLSGNGSVVLGGNSLALTNASGTFSGAISGSGGAVVDYGSETFSGANTYTGGTTLQGGSLTVSADNNLGDASGALNFGNAQLENTATFTSTRDITIADTAHFNTDAGTTLTDTAGSISGAGSIDKLGSGTLVLGAIDTSGNVDVQSGTLQVQGNSTYTGTTTIESGASLALTNNGAIASSAGVVADGTLDIGSANNPQSITSLSGASTGTVHLGGNGLTLTNANGEYQGTIDGSGGVTLDGGVEELAGNNSYSGGTTLNGGTLQVSSDANLGSASGALNFNGGTLENTASLTSTRNINATGPINIVTDAGTTLTDTEGSITGSGPIDKGGAGTLVLGADNSTGGVNVAAGTLQLTDAGTDAGVVNVFTGATLSLADNGSISSAAALVNDGTFDISHANSDQSITTLIGSGTGTVHLGSNNLALTNANGEYDGTIDGSGGVALNGGLEELTGTNTYTGGTTLNGGTLLVSSDANLGNASGALNFNGGTLENTASLTTSRDIHATGSVNIVTDAGTTLTDTAGTITGNGPINKGGTGTLVLGADNSTGGMNVMAGTVDLTGTSTDTGPANIASGATLAITGNGSDASASSINNNGTFDISQANNPQSISSLAGNGTVALGNNGLTLTDANGNFSGTIGGNGGVTLNGGVEQLSGTNTYTGGTTLNGGTVQVSSDANLGDPSGTLNFNGGTLENTASLTTARNINATGAVNIVTDAGTTLTDTAGSITGNGPITKGGTGTLVLGVDHSTGGVNVAGGTLQLTGTSTDTGATNIAAGATLALTGNGSDAASSSINNNGTFDVSHANGTQSISSLAGNGTVALGNNGLTLTNANGNYSGTIAGNGGVTLNGGTEVLSGTNNYTGGTTLNGGNLVVSSDANLGAAGTPVTFNGGTLTATQSMSTARNLVINDAGAVFNTLNGAVVQDSGAISGTGGLVKTGDGTLVVSGDNTFTGGTLIDGGVVKIDTGSSLGTGVILLNGGTLQTTASLSNSQNVVVSGNAGVNVNAGTSTTMSGNIAEAVGSGGCFVKNGAGTLDLTGTAVLANGTCVQEGMLRANGSLVSNVMVYGPGELRGVGVVTGPINVSGRLAPGNSPGTLTATGTVTMQAGSSYEEDIDGLGTGTGAGNYSRLIVSGANSQFIANGTLVPLLRGITGNASNTYTPQIGDVYQFVMAQGGVVGQFSSLIQPEGLAPNTHLVAFYNVNDNHSIELGVMPDSYASLIAGSGANRNALSLAGALDSALSLQGDGVASSGQSQLLYALADAKSTQLKAVLTNLSGEIYADEAAAGRAAGLAMRNDTLGHLTTDDSDVAHAQNGHLGWVNVTHDGNRWSGDAQASGFQTGTNQTTAGVDLYAGNGTVIGVAASNHDTDVNANAQQGTIRGNDGIVYGQQAVASVLVDGMVAHGHDTWITRRPDPTGVAGDLYSRAGGNNSMANLTARMPMTAGSVQLEPYASVTWQQFDRSGMNEADSPAALQVAHLSATGTRAELGVNLGSAQQNPLASQVTYRVGAAVGEDSRGLLNPAVQATLEGESFTTTAPDIGRGFVQMQANGTLRLSHAAYLYGGFTDELGARRGSYGLTAGVRVAF